MQGSAGPGVTEEEIASIIADVRAARLTYCGRPKLENLAAAAYRTVLAGVPGDFVEAGVALGGSAIVLAKIKPAGTALRLYDVFAMIPSPSERDGEDAHRRYDEIKSGSSRGLGDDVYYGYQSDLVHVVAQNLERFGVDVAKDRIEFVAGDFQETLRPPSPIALAHIDCDWYDSVKTCIERIGPALSVGGIIAFDDYSSYSGCRKVVDELLAREPRFETVFLSRSIGLRLSASLEPDWTLSRN